MREIKFRAFNKEIKKWEYFDLFSDAVSSISRLQDEFGCGGYFDRESVCQFTGLKDKNGKEIYEGDIVYASANDSRSVVKYGPYNCQYSEYDDDQHLGFYSEDPGEGHWQEGLYAKGEFYEVIGTIYENPELLAGDN